jgi:hypothetical protein
MYQFISHPLYKIHSIDSAMSSLWEFYKNKFVSLFLISFVMSIIMQYVSTLIDFKELQTMTDPAMMLAKLRDLMLPMLLISVVSLLFTTILHYYVIYNPLDSDNNIFVCSLKSLRYFLPYIVIIILLAFVGSFAILLGLLALVIGVFFSIVYILMIYLFILPVMMVEGIDIGKTISRTVTLAHRNFWANMGWTSVFIILLIVISIILSGIILLPFAGSFTKMLLNPQDVDSISNLTSNPAFIILSAAVNALTLPLLPIFASILYFNGKAREAEPMVKQSGDGSNGQVKIEDLYSKSKSDDEQDRSGVDQ